VEDHRGGPARTVVAPAAGRPTTPGGPPGPPPGTQAPGAPPASEDELRLVTALFADIVGSTTLGERLSPDAVKLVIGDFVGRMSGAVERYGGTVQSYMGDGIAAFFGVSRANEDDAERAARAGLAIVAEAEAYAAEVEESWQIADFGVRVGINTGPLAIGMVGAASPQAVSVGDTANVAARLPSRSATPSSRAASSRSRRGGWSRRRHRSRRGRSPRSSAATARWRACTTCSPRSPTGAGRSPSCWATPGSARAASSPSSAAAPTA
jgi:class 3 adenylate cyclase